jgi:hypothetical protein
VSICHEVQSPYLWRHHPWVGGRLQDRPPGLHSRAHPIPGSGNERAPEGKGVNPGAASAVHWLSSELPGGSSEILAHLTGIGRDEATKTLERWEWTDVGTSSISDNGGPYSLGRTVDLSGQLSNLSESLAVLIE